MLKLWGKKAQSTAEYAILIALVVGAVAAMQVYVKRGIQGRIKDVVDHTGGAGEVGGASFSFSTGQYEPYYLASDAATTRNSSNQEVLGKDGEVGRATGEYTGQVRQQVIGWSGADTAAVTEDPEVQEVARPATPHVEREE